MCKFTSKFTIRYKKILLKYMHKIIDIKFFVIYEYYIT